MRIAIISDIHGNLTAFEAVLADVRDSSPDLILHGGDLADGGSSPVEIVDRIRNLGWQGVVGNTDEMLFRPESLTQFAKGSPQLSALFATIGEMAAATRDALGRERLEWLSGLPLKQTHGPMALVHASPDDVWRSPAPEATDDELASVYSALGKPIVIYGHVHRPFVRQIGELTVANTGSVSLSYDGDRRASYLLLDGSTPQIRRVEYDIDKEIRVLGESGIPHWDWIARTLESGRPQMP